MFLLRHVCELGCPRSPFICLPQKHMEPPYARKLDPSIAPLPAPSSLSCVQSSFPPVCSRVPPTVPQAALLTAEEADIKLWVYKLSRSNFRQGITQQSVTRSKPIARVTAASASACPTLCVVCKSVSCSIPCSLLVCPRYSNKACFYKV